MYVLKKYMERFQRELELKSSLESAKQPGLYVIPISEELQINISEDSNGIHLESRLCPCPNSNQEDFFAHALRGDLFYEGTLGSTIGIDGSGKNVVLNRLIDYDVDYEQFNDIFDDFCNAAEQWVSEAGAF